MMDDFTRPPQRQPVRLDTLHEKPESTAPQPEHGFLPQPGGTVAPEVAPEQSAPPGQYQPRPSVYREPAFRTPGQVNEAGTPQQKPKFFLPPLEELPEIEAHASGPGPIKKRFFLFQKPNLTKKQWIITSVVAVVLIGSGAAAFALTHKKPAPVAVKAPAKVAPKPAPPPITSPLSGMVVTAAQHDCPVTGVMIENSSDARPQSGLDQAGVVFEAIAEAGITRFLALYQENNPQVLGPVRSSRPYYLDWAMAFDASYGHVGGSPDALQRIKDIGVKDLDQFYNSSAYHRISSRYAPHNMYTSIDNLVAAGNAKGYTSSTFTPFLRKKEQPSQAPSAKSINFAISSAFYNVHYDYNPGTNSYNRSEGGSPHTDNETKAQLSPKVVIALAMPYSLMSDGYHSQYQTTGSGNMLLFQDGIVIAGTWSKGGPKDQFIFKDGAGMDMKLNPGQTWITALGDITQAQYQP